MPLERYAEMPTATVDRAAAFNKQAFINRFREAVGKLLPSSYPRESATGMRKPALKQSLICYNTYYFVFIR